MLVARALALAHNASVLMRSSAGCCPSSGAKLKVFDCVCLWVGVVGVVQTEGVRGQVVAGRLTRVVSVGGVAAVRTVTFHAQQPEHQHHL